MRHSSWAVYASGMTEITPDIVDVLLSQWQQECPELESSGKSITGRIMRLHGHFLHATESALAPFGLKQGAYSVLSCLRLSGPPYQLHPKTLHEAALVTSGGMSNLLASMEKNGLIKRLPDPADKRGVLVHLTPKGRDIIDKAMAVQSQKDCKLTAALTAKERNELAALLRKLLAELEPQEQLQA